MEEQFVTYKIALKLKEKGFDEKCFAFYSSSSNKNDDNFTQLWPAYIISQDEDKQKNNIVESWQLTNNKSCVAPLWQQVIDWLREVHEIEIELSGITVYNIRKYHVCLYYKVDGIMTDHSMLLFEEKNGEYSGYQTFTYENARRVAIEEALKLI